MIRFAQITNTRANRSGGHVACVALALLCGTPAWADGATAGERGGPGLAVLTNKALVAELEGRQFVDDAVILIRDGVIESVATADATVIPEGYETLALGEHWVMPGMVDLHSHVGGNTRDYNDMVYQCNPGLRVSTSVVPNHPGLQRAIAAGVTTILFIPGSGTNIGGQGVLMKTAKDTYEGAVIRNPGSLKIAQGDNPTRWGYRMGRLLMNFHLRSTIRRGLAYAQQWEDFEANGGEKPDRDLQLDVFRDLKAHTTQISTHTQYYQLVMMSIQMLAVDYGLDVYIDHGSFDSYLNTDRAIEHEVAAILGPREVMFSRPPRFDTDGQCHGSAWGFQQRGHTRIGFNTDAGVVPQESLSLQAAMGVRYGMDDRNMDGVRGLTIIPAVTAGIADRVGSIEVGKDADLLVVTGDPCDPRTAVECVIIEGRIVYDTKREEEALVMLRSLIGLLVITATAFGAQDGQRNYALTVGKVLTVNDADQILTPGMLIVTDGKLAYVGVPTDVPADHAHLEFPDSWATPGMVDLHTHIHTGTWGDINDMVRAVNPEFRTSPTIRASNPKIRVACAGGVTTLLGIPGSGTNIGGFGVLYKSKTKSGYEGIVLADVGGMKVAQDSNPQRGAGDFGAGRAAMGWILEDVMQRAIAANEQGRRDPALMNLQRVANRELPVLIHTAGAEGVINTARMWRVTFDTRSVLSHGSFDGWKVAPALGEIGIPINHGPRTMDFRSSRNGKINGSAAIYSRTKSQNFSLNTDSGVIPQEEFFLQGSMAARYDGDPYTMVRALTANPAKAFGIEDRVGSLEVGKDADVVIRTGDPLDPRAAVELVLIDGEIQYEKKPGAQWF